MSVCYIGKNRDITYKCEYSINTDGIEVTVDYDVMDEIKPLSNGVRAFGKDTIFDSRDILVIDQNNHNYLLLKDAYLIGNNEKWGTPDSGCISRFYSDIYIKSDDFEDLLKLKDDPKISEIIIYSPYIFDIIGFKSITEETNKEEMIIKLNKKGTSNKIDINSNNIKSISISDNWDYSRRFKKYDIVIRYDGYIKIEFTKLIKFTNINEYIRELILNLHLYKPVNIVINKIMFLIDNKYYEVSIPINKSNNNSRVKESVNDNILSFLYNCYTKLPYRNSNGFSRNLYYLYVSKMHNIEDLFLMQYRSIESYYKQNNIQNNFIEQSYIEHFNSDSKLTDIDRYKYCYEIVSLRNHYVHYGYYLQDDKLAIKFKEDDNPYNLDNYSLNKVDFNFIYSRSEVLDRIVIDILFNSILLYKEYNFK